jgi:putative salt-induced outer membrane protein YdiY
LVCVCAAGGAARADEIFFKNGDRLTGQIVRLEDGVVVFQSKALGEVRFQAAELESFKSDQPLDVRLADGTKARAAVSDGAEGQVTIAPGTPTARRVPTEQVRAINPKEGWSGAVMAGLIVTRGNSNTENANVEADVERRRVQDRVTAGARYLFGRQRDPDTGDKTVTSDTWHVKGKYDYFFSPRFYGYLNGKVEQDNIANLDLRLTPGGGVGYQFFERPDFKAMGEAGLTYVYEKYSSPDDASATEFREHNEYLSGRLAYKLEKRYLNDRLTLFHNAEYLPSLHDVEDYLINADAGMRVGVTGSMFMEYKLSLTYDAMPAPGASNSDVRHLLSVGWKF